MDRTAYNALLAQYTTRSVSGNGRVSWDGGVKCVMPSVKLYGKCGQETLTGKNLWTTDAEYPIKSGSIDSVLYDTETQTYEIPAGDSMSISQSIYTLPEPIPAGTTVTIKAFFDSGQISGTISFGGYHSGTPRSWQGAIEFARGTDLAGKTYTETFVTTDTVTDFWVFLYSTAVVTEAIRWRMMYVIGDSAGDYEPYTGGQTMPSPALPSPVRCNNGTFRATDAEGVYDGGTVQAPELLAIPGTAYRDEWDAQTGRGVRHIKEYIFTGDESSWAINAYAQARGINAYQLYYFDPAPRQSAALCTYFAVRDWADGIVTDNNILYIIPNNGVVIKTDGVQTLEDFCDMLKSRYAAGDPVRLLYCMDQQPFASAPARLTMPSGPGQIIQTGGDVADCPITARYLTHS